jgi:hypothetical protein
LDDGRKFAGCFDVKCSDSGSEYEVRTFSGRRKLNFTCKYKGQRSEGMKYNFDFICQDPLKVCEQKTNCKNDCNYR